ncbi:MAG: ParB/RepB/Spo0J family partition protein [Flavobacteriales bacterium]|nr:ParB/RepB/Spo0J family partition protein [Flavobacteriales bacterium]
MAVKKNALGRGLGALLQNPDTDVTTGSAKGGGHVGAISEIPVSQIEANPFQPRTHFDQEKLDELAASIRQLGIIQPVTVRKLGYDRYQLISGERRFRASQLAGLTEIPAFVRIANDQSMLEMALVENIQRDELDAIEVALSYQRLIEECSLTQEALSERVGKQRSTIANYLRLLRLPPEIQKGIVDGLLTMGHARALINIDDVAEQLRLFRQIVSEQLSVRATEERSRGAKQNRAGGKKTASTGVPMALQRIVSHVQGQLGAPVAIKADAKGKGSLTIRFKDDRDLERVLSILDLLP